MHETGDTLALVQADVWGGAAITQDARVKIALTAIGLGLNIYEILRDNGAFE